MKAKVNRTDTERTNKYQITRYANKFKLDYPTNTLNEQESNLLFSLITTITTDQPTPEQIMIISVEWFKKLMNINKNITLKELKQLLINTFKKLNSLDVKIENEITTYYIKMFDCFGFGKSENSGHDYIFYRLGYTYRQYFFNLLKQYTTFQLREYTSIKGIYAKRLYEHLKQYRKDNESGHYRNINEWREILNIPNSAPNFRIINEYIQPATNELIKNNCFIDLTFHKVVINKKIKGIMFNWKNETENPKGQLIAPPNRTDLMDDYEYNLLIENIDGKITDQEYKEKLKLYNELKANKDISLKDKRKIGNITYHNRIK